MHVIARRTLAGFWRRRPDSKSQLEAWYHEAHNAQWRGSADIRARYGTASVINNERVVFNICGNKYRLVVRINYGSKTVFVRFIGSHEEYDRVNAETI